MQCYEPASKSHINKERQKARALKRSNWWKNKSQICYYCGNQIDKQDLTMDHKVPIARGGRSSKSNIVASCKKCNTLKKASTPAELIINSSF